MNSLTGIFNPLRWFGWLNRPAPLFTATPWPRDKKGIENHVGRVNHALAKLPRDIQYLLKHEGYTVYAISSIPHFIEQHLDQYAGQPLLRIVNGYTNGFTEKSRHYTDQRDILIPYRRIGNRASEHVFTDDPSRIVIVEVGNAINRICMSCEGKIFSDHPDFINALRQDLSSTKMKMTAFHNACEVNPLINRDVHKPEQTALNRELIFADLFMGVIAGRPAYKGLLPRTQKIVEELLVHKIPLLCHPRLPDPNSAPSTAPA